MQCAPVVESSDRERAVSGWHAELELWFEKTDGMTRLMRRRHVGPLSVQRPFHPEADGSAHVYLLHPPGGIAGGDRLAISSHFGPQSRAVLTTPGATKFYRCKQDPSALQTVIDVGADAICEYLPQETIFFDGANASIATRIMLAAGSIYLGWELISFGRPASGERFSTGRARQRVEIVRDGVPVWFEQFNLSGESRMIEAPFTFGGRPIFGTMVYVGPVMENFIERMREEVGEAASRVFSVTQLRQVVVCRYLGDRMSEGKRLFLQAWDVLREAGIGKRAVAPRVWAT